MTENAPGIRLSIGVSGSGKTYGLRQSIYRAVRAGVPTLVLDPTHEWRELPPDVMRLARGVEGTTRDAGVRLAVEWPKQGARLVILRSLDAPRDLELACQWAAPPPGVARKPPGHVAIAMSEAHIAWPNEGRLTGARDSVITRWRHHQVSLYLDTQRLALLHRTVTEQARELRVYAVGGERDLERLREHGGRALADAAQECARRLVAGEPGWHVSIRTVAIPPYTLEREA